MRIRIVVLLPLVLAAIAPATAQLACQGGQKNMAVAELMFGRKIGDRIGVGNASWARFVDTEITPRFPDGLSVVDAAGQWRDTKTKRVVREPSKLVTIVLKDAAADQPALEAIADAYKRRFRQQSVAIIVRPACVSF
jgi:hypothetical protein